MFVHRTPVKRAACSVFRRTVCIAQAQSGPDRAVCSGVATTVGLKRAESFAALRDGFGLLLPADWEGEWYVIVRC